MLKNPLYSLFLLILPLSTILLSSYLTNKFKISNEINRKFIHIIIGIIAILGFIEGPLIIYIYSILLLTLLIIVAIYKMRLKSIFQIKRQSYGEVFLPLGLLLTLAISYNKPDLYVTSILILTFADSMAALTGKIFNKKNKSVIGSCVFLIVSLLILVLKIDIPLYYIVTITLFLTIVERLSKYGSDNVTVPLATVGLLLLFNT